MRIEDEHTDVLQNIEFAVVALYRDCPEMTDYNVARAYEAAIDAYSAERIGRPPREWQPTDLELRLFDAVGEMCEWRLGRTSPMEVPPDENSVTPIDCETLLRCLKRLRKSTRTWSKRGGRQGYLNFISQFVG